MRGQTTDHIRPRSQRATAVITRTSSSSTEIRADARSAARDLAELNEADMRAPYGQATALPRSPANAAASKVCWTPLRDGRATR